jgi:hypothetical protein
MTKYNQRLPVAVSTMRYILSICVVLGLCSISFLLGIILFQNELPAPRFSASYSFNEKARWLKFNLPPKCDVLIIGSSVALNNVDARELDLLYPGGTVINTGFWGATTEETARMLKEIIPLCKPKMVLFPAFYGDFQKTNSQSGIEWNQFEKYVKGGSTLLGYLFNLDYSYYSRNIKAHLNYTKMGHKTYFCLEFDKTGTVNLDSTQFAVDPRRWNGYKSSTFTFSNVKPTMIDSVSDIAQMAKSNNSQLVVVSTPMLPVAERYVGTNEVSKLWEAVQKRVSAEGGLYINVTSEDGFNDQMFVDYAHLNCVGAKMFTRKIVDAIPR